MARLRKQLGKQEVYKVGIYGSRLVTIFLTIEQKSLRNHSLRPNMYIENVEGASSFFSDDVQKCWPVSEHARGGFGQALHDRSQLPTSNFSRISTITHKTGLVCCLGWFVGATYYTRWWRRRGLSGVHRKMPRRNLVFGLGNTQAHQLLCKIPRNPQIGC